jgi:hypothetical protein
MKRARTALEEVVAAAADDPHLKPMDGKAVKVEGDGTGAGAEAFVRYDTPDAWPDLPSKPTGRAPGHGSVWVRVIRGPARTTLDAPFLPPGHCHYALSAYGTSVPGVNVSVWSMTRDPSAHRRLEGLVRAKLKAAGIEMDARPLAPPVRASGTPEDGPPAGAAPLPGTGPKGKPGGAPPPP